MLQIPLPPPPKKTPNLPESPLNKEQSWSNLFPYSKLILEYALGSGVAW